MPPLVRPPIALCLGGGFHHALASQPRSKEGCPFWGEADADFVSVFPDGAFFIQGKDGTWCGWDVARQHPRTQLIAIGLHGMLKGFGCRRRLRVIHELGQELEDEVMGEHGEEIIQVLRHAVYCMFGITLCIEICDSPSLLSVFSVSFISCRLSESLALYARIEPDAFRCKDQP